MGTRTARAALPLALVGALCAATSASAAPLPPSGTLDLGAVEPGQAVTWTSKEANGLAGAAVTSIGDFNGDGKADVAVGEPKGDVEGAPDAGVVYVVLDAGKGGDLTASTDVVRIRGAAAGDLAGQALDAAGDVNGDGLADLVVGAPGAGGSEPERADRSGEAYVVFGRADRSDITLSGAFGGLRLFGAEAGAQLGRAVGAIGDLNGDGLGEVLVSAPARDVADRPSAGSAYVVFGSKEGGEVPMGDLVERGAGWRIDGPIGSSAGGAQAGRAVASIGDLDGDGRPEVLVTAPRAGTGLAPRAGAKGIAYVVFGRDKAGVVDLENLGDQGWSVTGKVTSKGNEGDGKTAGDQLGESIEPVGDVNGDLRPDFVVGAHLADATDRKNVGLAYVVFGKSNALPVDVDRFEGGGFRITGVDEQDQTGFDTARAGDFDGDGIEDLALSSLFADPLSRVNAGAVYVVLGERGAPKDLDLAELGDRGLRIAGGAAGDVFGFSVDGAGDVDGDGGQDLVIGATGIDADYLVTNRADRPGTATIVFGASPAKPADNPVSEIVSDPGYLEAVKAGCVTSTNVQVLMEDNRYTDEDADPARIRMAGMQTYVATPRNQGTVLGVTGFTPGGDAEADPIISPTVLAADQTAKLNKALLTEVDGDDGFPGYPFMARTFANDNPGASARILLVDGYLFRRMTEFSGLTEGNPPTYVIAVGSPPDRSRSDIREMKRLARETKGRYYESRSPRAIEKAFQDIESRLRCDLETDDYKADLDPGETDELAETTLDPGVHTADVKISWRSPKAGFEVAKIDVVRNGAVVRRLGAAAIARAYGKTSGTAAVVGGRGRTFRSLHLRGLRSGSKLRVSVRPQAGKRSGVVYGRVTQSRRRR